MDILSFIVGIFLLWQGQLKVSKKSAEWPKSKKTGRIIGGILLLPLIIETMFIYINPPSPTQSTTKYESLAPGAFYSNQQYGFKIIPPSGWIIAPSSFLDKDPAAGQIAMFVDRPDSIQSIIAVSSITIPGTAITDSDLDAYVNNQAKIAQNTTNSLFISNNKVTSNGTIYYLMEYKQKVSGGSGMSHVLQLISLGKNKNIFLVTSSSDDTMWTNFKDILKSSLLSFSAN